LVKLAGAMTTFAEKNLNVQSNESYKLATIESKNPYYLSALKQKPVFVVNNIKLITLYLRVHGEGQV